MLLCMTKVMVTVIVQIMAACVREGRKMMARVVRGVMAKLVVKLILEMTDEYWKILNKSGGERK